MAAGALLTAENTYQHINLVTCFTSTPVNHKDFIFYRIPVVLETADHLGGWGAHPLHPPPRSTPADCHCELLFDSFDLLSKSDVFHFQPCQEELQPRSYADEARC